MRKPPKITVTIDLSKRTQSVDTHGDKFVIWGLPTPDRSGEADKTGTGLAEGESGLPEGSS